MQGWKPLITIGVLSLAGFLLFRTLSRYSMDELVVAVAAVPASRLIAATGFALASYVSLTGFDYLALHYVGQPLPYFKAALASFTSLSLGHNIGFAALSSGAIRYRFYTRWGLSPVQVAKIIVFCGVTVGLGLMVLGGAALLLRTELAREITGLAKPVIIGFGIGCLAAPLVYLILAAVIRRPLVIRHWSLDMPSPWIAVGQIAVGSINFAFVAACLHQTLAAVTDVAYPGVASVYVIANATALVSHVPGGLGVIESVVMHLLPQRDLIGPLLAFRFVYFLAPLGFGSLLFLVTELIYRRTQKGRAATDGGKARSSSSPSEKPQRLEGL